MINELYVNISEGNELRASLIALKKAIKDVGEKRKLAYLLGGDYSVIAALLKNEDAKVRKNAALILGAMECDDMLPELWRAYQSEEQLFVRSSYLTAMAAYDCREYLPGLRMRRDALLENPAAEGNEKHMKDELAALRQILSQYENEKKHVFTGLAREADVILLTNRKYREITEGQVKEGSRALLAGGVRVHTRNVEQFSDIRTWSEMLFPIPGAALLSEEPQEAARKLAGSRLVSFLDSCHRGNSPFYFRIEVRGMADRDKKDIFVRKLAAAIEKETAMGMINSASDYEIELRLLKRKDGGFVPLLKLYTIRDKRFSYRKNVLASSIQPANAALVMELLRPYLKKGAQVLDPFCGTGTMLIERQRAMAAEPLYGIDIYPKAIEMARENAKAANVTINFINRDFLDFRHEYLFDEVITNMPTVTGQKGVEEIAALYDGFLIKVREVLKNGGILAVYTSEEGILMHCLKGKGFLRTEKRWQIRDNEGSVLWVLRYQPESGD